MLDVTLITAALLAFVNIWLGYRVGQIRTREKVSLGDAGKPALVARMRAHANFGEYVPLTVILIGLIEMAGAARTPLIVAGEALSVALVGHAYGSGMAAAQQLCPGGQGAQHDAQAG